MASIKLKIELYKMPPRLPENLIKGLVLCLLLPFYIIQKFRCSKEPMQDGLSYHFLANGHKLRAVGWQVIVAEAPTNSEIFLGELGHVPLSRRKSFLKIQPRSESGHISVIDMVYDIGATCSLRPQALSFPNPYMVGIPRGGLEVYTSPPYDKKTYDQGVTDFVKHFPILTL